MSNTSELFCKRCGLENRTDTLLPLCPNCGTHIVPILNEKIAQNSRTTKLPFYCHYKIVLKLRDEFLECQNKGVLKKTITGRMEIRKSGRFHVAVTMLWFVKMEIDELVHDIQKSITNLPNGSSDVRMGESFINYLTILRQSVNNLSDLAEACEQSFNPEISDIDRFADGFKKLDVSVNLSLFAQATSFRVDNEKDMMKMFKNYCFPKTYKY